MARSTGFVPGDVNFAVGEILVHVSSMSFDGDGPNGTKAVSFFQILRFTPKRVWLFELRKVVVKVFPEANGSLYFDSMRSFDPIPLHETEVADILNSPGADQIQGRIDLRFGDRHPDEWCVTWSSKASVLPVRAHRWDGNPVVGNK